jgi:hypothetical protein
MIGKRVAIACAISLVSFGTGARSASSDSVDPATSVATSAARSTALPGSTFFPLRGARILDSAAGTGGLSGPLGGDATVSLAVLGHGGVPRSGVSAVLLELTAMSPSASGYLTVYPAGARRPSLRQLSTSKEQTQTATVVVRPGRRGDVSIYNRVGTVDLQAQLIGYYLTVTTSPAPGSTYVPLGGRRIVDSTTGQGGVTGRVGRGATVTFDVLDRGGVPSTGISAVVLELSAITPSRSGYLTVYPDGRSRPSLRQLSTTEGQTQTAPVVVRPGANGRVAVYNRAGQVGLRVEVAGFYATSAAHVAGSTFFALSGAPLLDTAKGTGGVPGSVPAGATVTFPALGHGGVPSAGVSALVVELTAIVPSASGHLTVYPAGGSQSSIRQMSTSKGQTQTTSIVVRPGTQGRVAIYNRAGAVNLRAQVVGYLLAPNWVVAENARAGTTAWHLKKEGSTNAIQGYADRTSVAPGQSFGLYVETTAARWEVTAFRVGWYHGNGGRRVWTSVWHRRQAQPAAVTSAGTHTVTAPWHKSLTVATTGWPAGSYLLKLHSSAGNERYVPITVRSKSTRARMVLMNEDLTWQAYNEWGGRDLYLGPGGYSDRSYVVSFDRPYDRGGAYKFQEFEQALISRAERLGLAMAYTTDIYVSEHPYSIEHARAVLSPGHDEYWTWKERNGVLRARDHGANLAFFGANAQYWQVRLGSTSRGADRTVICYKTDVARDPASGSERETTRWRDLPQPKPESAMVGLMYECYPVEGRYVVRTPAFFAFRGTGAKRGSSYPGLVGLEIDRARAGSATPRPIQIVAHSPVRCSGANTYSDSSYYVAPSKAGVFASGTMRWTQALAGAARSYGVTDATINFVRIATDNVLRAFAVGPAGLRHMPRDNLGSV